jgi:putative ABC transport system permease protein
MRFADYITLALRNIMRQKLRSALTIFAVVIGATSVAIMLALVFGAKSFFLTQLNATGMLQQVAVSPHTDITDFNSASYNGTYNCADCVKLSDNLATKISKLNHVTGVARVIHNNPFEAISLDGQKLTVQSMTAYDANGIVVSNVLAGRDLSPSDKSGVVTITSDYADKFGYKNNYQGIIGKTVSLQSQNWYSGVGAHVLSPSEQGSQQYGPNNSPPPTVLTAKIVGVTDTNNQSATIRVPLEWMRGMIEQRSYQTTPADQAADKAAQEKCQRTPGPCNPTQHMSLVTTDMVAKNGYDSFTVKVDDVANAASVTSAIKKFGVGAADAETFIKAQLSIFNIVGLVLGGIGGIALAVAAIGVVNTMIMAILERTREIGVMRAVGAKRSAVSALFTFEAALLGFWGGVFGIAVGYGLTRVANVFINKQLASNGLKAHNIIGLPWWLILTVIGTTTLIGILAGLYPARRAAKLDPVEALHYE